MDIREYNPKKLPYHFVLFYNLPIDKQLVFRKMYQGTTADNALLTYCYLDSMCGLSYKAICGAYVSDEGKVEYHNARKMTVGLTLREGGLECDAAIFDEEDMPLFREEAERIKANYGYKKESTNISEDVPFDEYRHPSYPNDILVSFFAPDKKLEKIWVTEQERSRDGVLTAKVLNEPFDSLMGVHEGDTVKVIPYDTGDGKIIPTAVLPWMRDM